MKKQLPVPPTRPRLALLAIVAGSVFSVSAQQDYVVPRTEWGVPDLQGFWSLATQTRLERPARFEGRSVISREEALQYEATVMARNEESYQPSDPGREAPSAGINVGGYNTFWMDPGNHLAVINGEVRTSVIVDPPDGKLPYSDQGLINFAAANALRESYDGPEVRPEGERCVVGFGSTAGPPKLPVLYNNMTQIIQNEGYVVLLAEMNHDARIVRIGGTFQDPPLNPWLGDSIGRYEGATLIVETTNFHPQQTLRSSTDHRFLMSPSMHAVERFTRVGENEILYQFTITDPSNYSRPWSGELPMVQTGERLFEYACHEGNYAMPGILAGARRAEKEGQPYAPTN